MQLQEQVKNTDMLTFLCEAPKRGKYRMGRFRCKCGNTKVLRYTHVKNGSSKSCGCLQKEASKKSNGKEISYKVDSNGCHICNSHFLLRGYPLITVGGKNMPMSRYVWEKNNGTIDKGLMVRHKCDNPTCINIEHMELGTHKENMKDRAIRMTGARGEKAYKSKLKENQVKEIQVSNLSITELAKLYNVNQSTISKIKKGKSWRHLLENNLLPTTTNEA